MKTPTKRTTRRIAASIAIVTALAASSALATDRTISANYTLTGDETVDGVLTVASGVTVDLKHYNLTVQGLAGNGTITSSAAYNHDDDLTTSDGEMYWSTKNNVAFAGNTSPRNLFNNNYSRQQDGTHRILLATTGLPCAIVYDFGTPQKIDAYKMYVGPLGDLYKRGPKAWTIEGSNGNSTWTELDNRSSVTWPKTQETRTYTFENSNTYRWYRIKITASNDKANASDGYLELVQLEYFITNPELHVNVLHGDTATNSTVTIAGNIKVVKEGEGEFAEAKAGQSYTGGTVLTDGTYALAGTATLDWSKFTFGTDPAKLVTLSFGADTALSPIPDSLYVGNEANITSTVYKTGGDWSLGQLTVGGRASGVVSKFYHTGGSMALSSSLVVCHGTSTSSHGDLGYFEISGGSVTNSHETSNVAIVGQYGQGKMVVKSGGEYVSKNTLIIGNYEGSQGTLDIDDGGMVTIAKSIIFNYTSTDSTGIVNLRSGGVLFTDRMYRNKDGSATFNFDGGTLIIAADIAANKLFSKQNGTGEVTVTVSENGGTIDNGGNANSSAIGNTITGAGGLTLTGSGTTRVFADQAYLGTTTVSNGTTLSVTHVAFAGPVAFAADSTLNIDSYTAGVTPLAASALTLPAEGTVGLTLNGGAFPVGVYAICSATGVTAADGAKFAPSTGGETASWKVVGDTLVLTVGTVADNYWTGFAGDGKMSTPGNWAGGTAPKDGEDVDFSSVTVTTTIDADIANVTFGAVTMGSGAVVFANDNMRATSFSDLEKVAVAANSTVTLVGDLVFGTNVESCVCRYVSEGGRFVVTGDIIATPEQTGVLYASLNAPGWISAKGLVNNAAGDKFYLVQANNWQANWLIGEDGISGAYRYTVGASGKGNATIKATADFAVSSVIIQRNNLVLAPDGHVITLGKSVAANAGGIISGGDNGLTTVTGPGKVVVNYNVTNLTTYAVSQPNSFTVADGGTLAIVPGANPSVSTDNNGKLTVNDGATLEVAESGTVTLGSSLALANDAALGFNFTTRDEPVLNLTGKTVTFDEGATTNVVVKILSAEGARAKAGANVLTSGGKFADAAVSLAPGAPDWAMGVSVVDGDIVLSVRPMGTIFFIK